MARALHRIRSMRSRIATFTRALYRAVVDDDITDAAAMLAYYAILAIFPMVIFVGTLALLVVPPSTVHQGLAMVTEALPIEVREVLTARLDVLIQARSTGVAVVTLAFALWGASRGAVGLRVALNHIYGRRDRRSFWRRQAVAIAATIAVAVIAVIALALLVVGPFVTDVIAARIGGGAAFELAWTYGRWIGAGLLIMVVWAIIYRYLPDTDARFRVFTPGALIGVAGWLAISALFGVYLSHFHSYEATYGALGGAIIFLLWLWLSGIALLFGAEINDVLDDMHRADRARIEFGDVATPGLLAADRGLPGRHD